MGTFIILAVVVLCFVVSVLFGLAASWKRQHISEDYFLAGRSLPWFAVALSIAGTSFRLETWLGMIGLCYAVGVAAGSLAWGNFLATSALAWLFLPFFIRKKLYSPAEFLERRYSPSVRGIYAMLTILVLVFGVLAPALYLGGWVLCEGGLGVMVDGFSWQLIACIAAVAIVAALYSVYGGLMAGAWAGAIQLLIVIAGGTLLAVVATKDAGGLVAVMQKNAGERMILLHPAQVPGLNGASLTWTGLVAFWFTIAMWNAGASPVTVQRCLGARSEWDAKMGVIVAGLLQVLLAALIVLPGLAALVKLGLPANTGLSYDHAALKLIDTLFGREGWLGPLGQGLVVSAVLAAVLCTASGVINAVSSLWTMDLCQDLWRGGLSEAELVARGRWTSFGTILLGALAAPLLALWEKGILSYVLEVSAAIGPPIVVVFLVAFLWPRAHGRPAVVTLVLGVIVGVLLWIVAALGADVPPWLLPVMNRAGISGVVSLLLLVLGTFIIPQNPNELYDPDTAWNLRWSRLPPHEQDAGSGFGNLVFWWAVMIAANVAVWVVLR